MLDRYVTTLERAGLPQCVFLAAVSTAAWYILVAGTNVEATPLPGTWEDLPDWLLLWASGAVYSVLVLFRYLPPAQRGWRAATFALAGAVSYWIGVNFTLHASPMDDPVATTAVAGAVTAAGLGCLAVSVGTLRFSPAFFVALCIAGALGGAATTAEPLVEWVDDFVVGHAAWQTLTCVVFYYTPKSAK